MIIVPSTFFEKYPFWIVGERDLETSVLIKPYEGCTDLSDLPRGWLDLCIRLSEELRKVLINENLLDRFYFVQAKEKYGELIIYPNFVTPEIDEILMRYQDESSKICQLCGATAMKQTKRWIGYYCIDCYEEMYEK